MSSERDYLLRAQVDPILNPKRQLAEVNISHAAPPKANAVLDLIERLTAHVLQTFHIGERIRIYKLPSGRSGAQGPRIRHLALINHIQRLIELVERKHLPRNFRATNVYKCQKNDCNPSVTKKRTISRSTSGSGRPEGFSTGSITHRRIHSYNERLFCTAYT